MIVVDAVYGLALLVIGLVTGWPVSSSQTAFTTNCPAVIESSVHATMKRPLGRAATAGVDGPFIVVIEVSVIEVAAPAASTTTAKSVAPSDHAAIVAPSPLVATDG